MGLVDLVSGIPMMHYLELDCDDCDRYYDAHDYDHWCKNWCPNDDKATIVKTHLLENQYGWLAFHWWWWLCCPWVTVSMNMVWNKGSGVSGGEVAGGDVGQVELALSHIPHLCVLMVAVILMLMVILMVVMVMVIVSPKFPSCLSTFVNQISTDVSLKKGWRGEKMRLWRKEKERYISSSLAPGWN